MSPTDKIDNLIKHLKTPASPELDARIEALLEQPRQQPARPPNTWSRIMKSNITKTAAAAVIVVGVFVGFNMLNGTRAYAIEQTIEAGRNIRYLHFYFHASPDSNVPDKEAWLEYDESGQIKNTRVNWYNPSGSDMVAVWKEGKTQYWTKEKRTLKFFEDEIYTKKCVGFANRYDPTKTVENMCRLEKKGDVRIEIEEPRDKTKPIILTCTWLPNTYATVGTCPQMREIVFIDPVTKLVTSIEVYKLTDGEYGDCGVYTYPDYDTLFEPGLFDLEQEAPADVKRIDLMTLDVGMEQTDLSDKEIAVKVMRSFLEALINKDYDRAIKIYGYEDPDKKGELLERFQKLDVVRIISIDDPVSPQMDFHGKLEVPCKVELEENGQIITWQIDDVYAERVIGHPNRWRLDGKFEK